LKKCHQFLIAQKYVATLPYYLEKTLGGSIKIVVNKMLNVLRGG
jgi:hypothetical protein